MWLLQSLCGVGQQRASVVHGAPPAMDVSSGAPPRASRSSGAAASGSASVPGGAKELGQLVDDRVDAVADLADELGP